MYCVIMYITLNCILYFVSCILYWVFYCVHVVCIVNCILCCMYCIILHIIIMRNKLLKFLYCYEHNTCSHGNHTNLMTYMRDKLRTATVLKVLNVKYQKNPMSQYWTIYKKSNLFNQKSQKMANFPTMASGAVYTL